MAGRSKTPSTPKDRGVLGLVAINLGVLVGLFFISLLLVVLTGDIYQLVKPAFKSHDIRASSQAYESDAARLRARQIYAETRQGSKSYRPYIAWRQNPISLETVTVDKNGYRTHKAGRDAAAGARSIGFFGGSTMWGVGVEDDQTIPAHFDQITAGFAVTNYSERGFTSRQSLAELINLINRGKAPEVVVFYDGFNDVWTHCNYAVTRALNSHQEEPHLRGLVEKARDRSLFYQTFIDPFFDVAQQLKSKRVQADKLACSSDPARAGQVARVLVKNWEMAHRLVAGYGGTFHAFLQPNLYVGSPRRDHVALKRKQRGRGKEQVVVYKLVQERLAKLQARWAHDISGAFDGTRPVYLDDAHVNSAGNKIIAEKMHKVIIENAQKAASRN